MSYHYSGLGQLMQPRTLTAIAPVAPVAPGPTPVELQLGPIPVQLGPVPVEPMPVELQFGPITYRAPPAPTIQPVMRLETQPVAPGIDIPRGVLPPTPPPPIAPATQERCATAGGVYFDPSTNQCLGYSPECTKAGALYDPINKKCVFVPYEDKKIPTAKPAVGVGTVAVIGAAALAALTLLR